MNQCPICNKPFIILDSQDVKICLDCNKKFITDKNIENLNRSKIHIQNRIDKIINDIEIIKQEIIFSRHFKADFITWEIPTLNITREQFKELKQKISIYSFGENKNIY